MSTFLCARAYFRRFTTDVIIFILAGRGFPGVLLLPSPASRHESAAGFRKGASGDRFWRFYAALGLPRSWLCGGSQSHIQPHAYLLGVALESPQRPVDSKAYRPLRCPAQKRPPVPQSLILLWVPHPRLGTSLQHRQSECSDTFPAPSHSLPTSLSGLLPFR